MQHINVRLKSSAYVSRLVYSYLPAFRQQSYESLAPLRRSRRSKKQSYGFCVRRTVPCACSDDNAVRFIKTTRLVVWFLYDTAQRNTDKITKNNSFSVGRIAFVQNVPCFFADPNPANALSVIGVLQTTDTTQRHRRALRGVVVRILTE